MLISILSAKNHYEGWGWELLFTSYLDMVTRIMHANKDVPIGISAKTLVKYKHLFFSKI